MLDVLTIEQVTNLTQYYWWILWSYINHKNNLEIIMQTPFIYWYNIS